MVKGDKPFKILEVKGGDGLVTALSDGNEAKQAYRSACHQPSEAGDSREDDHGSRHGQRKRAT